MSTRTAKASRSAGLRPAPVPGLRGDRGRRHPDHARGQAPGAARPPWRRPVRGHVGDPRRLQAARRDARRGRPARARGGDRRRRRQPPRPVRGVRRPGPGPAHERRDGRPTSPSCGTSARSPPAPTPPRPGSTRWTTSSRAASSSPSTTSASSATPSSASAPELEATGIATAFVGTEFTPHELRAVYEAVWGIRLDSANFRRSVAERGWVIPTGRRARPGPEGGKPAELFRAGDAWTHGGPIRRPHPAPERPHR